MADIYQPEDLRAYVYKWQEKEVSDTVVNGSTQTFSLNHSIANIKGFGATPTVDYVDANGNYAIRDLVVYYRKNGIDTRVDEASISSISGTTVIFTGVVATTSADSIAVSYAYADSGDKTTFTCSVKDFEKSGGDADSEVVNTIGGCSYKRKTPAELVEISLTAIKNGVRLSEAANGDIIRTTSEVAGYTIRTTSQTRNRTPRVIVIKGMDPVNTTISLISIARNVDGVTASHSGGADNEWEESVSYKTDQQNYAELEVE
jgi:hypothetical protein